MPVLLTITNSEILKLCRLDPADAAADADATEVKNQQQEALEKTLKSSAFADASLTVLLRRNVAKLLAAEILAMRYREDGASGSFSGAGVTLSAPPDLAMVLRQEAETALALYKARPVGISVAADGREAKAPTTGAGAQETLFGADEAALTVRFAPHWRD